jgi:hypothetical protein
MPKAPSSAVASSKAAPSPLLAKPSKGKAKANGTAPTADAVKGDIDDIFGATSSSKKANDIQQQGTELIAPSTTSKKKKKQHKKVDESVAQPLPATETQPTQPAVQTVVDPSAIITSSAPATKSKSIKAKAVDKPRLDEEELAFRDSRGTGPREFAFPAPRCQMLTINVSLTMQAGPLRRDS